MENFFYFQVKYKNLFILILYKAEIHKIYENDTLIATDPFRNQQPRFYYNFSKQGIYLIKYQYINYIN